MTLTVISPPAAPAVSRDEVKDHLRIGHDGEDALVDRLISEATAWLETGADIALVQRRLMRSFDGWSPRIAGRGLLLRPALATQLVSVEIRPIDGAPTENVVARFGLLGGRRRLRPGQGLPNLDGGALIDVVFDAGFSAPVDIPADLKLAVKSLAHEIYARGVSETPHGLPKTVSALLAAHREVQL